MLAIGNMKLNINDNSDKFGNLCKCFVLMFFDYII